MVIRHGEKPTDTERGVSYEGVPKRKSLTIAGWTRAGATAELFAPATGPTRAGLVRPRAIFASNRRGRGGGSDREQETVRLLAQRLGIEVNTDHGAGEEPELMHTVKATAGPILICWKHDYIPALAGHLDDIRPAVPTAWPADRYDSVWVFTRRHGSGSPHYEFSQVPELILPGDTAAPLA